nr:hypothetical protein [Variovorax boronicumulans]
MPSLHTRYQTQYFAWLRSRRMVGDSPVLLVTTLFDAAREEVDAACSLLVCCGAWRGATVAQTTERVHHDLFGEGRA